uniref:DUF5681 domain-containing protein n=1 Tax=Altererythrobacter segetis TaxID=1104773 RepID=UPI00140D1A43|nr:DUF5681 domain-containing protein [Altererythrobacter segetis]
MSRGGHTRFSKGQSGNPKGRPKARRPHVSAFDIIFDKTLTVTQGGVERELTIDEALQLQTYQAALKGSRMAIRQVLKMIEKREAALAKLNPPKSRALTMEVEHDADNADEAMRILGIATLDKTEDSGGYWSTHLRLATWATQAALSRPGRRRLTEKDVEDIKRLTCSPERLKWPRGRLA